MRSILSNGLSVRDQFVFASDDTDETETAAEETSSAAATDSGIAFSLRASASELRASLSEDADTGFTVTIGGGQIELAEGAETIALPAGPITNTFVFGAVLESEGRGESRFQRITDTYISGSADGSDFNIQIDFRGQWDETLKQSFIDAADLLSTIIVGDIDDAQVPGFGILRSNIVDDLRIDAYLSDIDGSGGVLGQAGPRSYRTDSLLPATGLMEFDVADASDFDDIGMFNDIVFHEMMHVLGFGTLWEAMGLVQENADGTLNFLGENALTAYAAEGGGNTPIQIETDGGSGTAGGHWDDELYDNEIMTGYINTEGNYLSNTTIAALEDMGYDTVFDPTDPLAATSGLDLTIFNDHIV